MKWYSPLKLWAGKWQQGLWVISFRFQSHPFYFSLSPLQCTVQAGRQAGQAPWASCLLWRTSNLAGWLWTQLLSTADHNLPLDNSYDTDKWICLSTFERIRTGSGWPIFVTDFYVLDKWLYLVWRMAKACRLYLGILSGTLNDSYPTFGEIQVHLAYVYGILNLGCPTHSFYQVLQEESCSIKRWIIFSLVEITYKFHLTMSQYP